MINEPTKSADEDDRHFATTPKSKEMRQADTANGENPDADTDGPSPATQHAEQEAHPTGERQARKNVEEDPPA